jgi:hypothetical protein
MATLARLLDPEALDEHEGSIGRFAIEVPSAWRGRTVRIVAPRRVTCSRCAGGGCDSCSKSGAFRIEGSEDERTFDVVLPESESALLRILHPLGQKGPIDMLLLETRQAERASECVTPARPLGIAQERAGATPLGIMLAVALFAIVTYLMLR